MMRGPLLHKIFNEAPLSFPLSSSQVNILRDPSQFYDSLLEGIGTAKSKITLASLYLGSSESEIVNALHRQMSQNPSLRLSILLDYFRGTRGSPNSCDLLLKLKRDFKHRCQLSFYKTPNMSPFLEKWMPPRWNEVLGLQHIKDIILSGANLNHDYFTNRQDRYLMVKESQEVSDFFSDLVSHISAFSHSLEIPESPKGTSASLYLLSPHCKSKNPIEMGSSFMANQYQDWVARTRSALDSGTHLIPAIQMGLSNARQEEKVFEDLFKAIGEEAPDYRIDMSSAYLNFPTSFQDMVIQSPCRMRILTSAPQANGFYGAKNMSGHLPKSYTYLESKLMEKIVKAGRQTDVQLFEYHRPGWTFHAKGLWVSDDTESHTLTTIGSSNFNARSLDRDLELQSFLVTDCPDLSQRIKENREYIFEMSSRVDSSTFQSPERRVPPLVKVATSLIRSML